MVMYMYDYYYNIPSRKSIQIRWLVAIYFLMVIRQLWRNYAIYMYSTHHKNSDVSIPFHLNGPCSMPFTVPFVFHMHKRLINTLGVSYQRVRYSTAHVKGKCYTRVWRRRSTGMPYPARVWIAAYKRVHCALHAHTCSQLIFGHGGNFWTCDCRDRAKVWQKA